MSGSETISKTTDEERLELAMRAEERADEAERQRMQDRIRHLEQALQAAGRVLLPYVKRR